MHDRSSTPRPIRSLIACLALLPASFAAHGTDTYGPAPDELQIPTLRIGGATYSSVVLTIGQVISGPSGSVAVGAEDLYSPLTRELTVPAVKVGASTYYNAIATVAQLSSIGGVAGADSFDGTHLTIPYALVGTTPFYNVVLAVSLANIAAVYGGMPLASTDQYNLATRQLTIPAVQVGPEVYTNVVLNVNASNIVSSGFSESVLYSFGAIGGGDGYDPQASLLQASDGNFYAMTLFGGQNGKGALVRITPAGGEAVLYSLGSNPGDGTYPAGGTLLEASDGNFYTMTNSGGANGNGAVLRITPAGSESVLYSFGSSASKDGSSPLAGLVQASDGNLYGTTASGGANGTGAIVKITLNGTESVLYSFGSTPEDGAGPQYGSLIQAADGNLYGMTSSGGAAGQGAVIKASLTGQESVLYSFGTNANDGTHPVGGLIQATDGNLYAITSAGGANRDGAAVKISLSGSESVLYSLGTNSQDGVSPYGTLIQASDGNFYGLTRYGGANDGGAVIRITPAGAESVLYSFGSGTGDGVNPLGSLIQGSDGNLYAPTLSGGAHNTGAVIRINW